MYREGDAVRQKSKRLDFTLPGRRRNFYPVPTLFQNQAEIFRAGNPAANGKTRAELPSAGRLLLRQMIGHIPGRC